MVAFNKGVSPGEMQKFLEMNGEALAQVATKYGVSFRRTSAGNGKESLQTAFVTEAGKRRFEDMLADPAKLGVLPEMVSGLTSVIGEVVVNRQVSSLTLAA